MCSFPNFVKYVELTTFVTKLVVMSLCALGAVGVLQPLCVGLLRDTFLGKTERLFGSERLSVSPLDF